MAESHKPEIVPVMATMQNVVGYILVFFEISYTLAASFRKY
jgi:hypothetical protein